MARKYRRDNRGRFAGDGGGATDRGGRLKTAAGNKRKTQTMKAGGAKAAGTVGKPKGLKPGAIKAKPQVSSARQAATDRLKIKTQTRRKLRADRASVIPVTSAGPKTIKTARPRSTVAKQRTKGNTQAQVASRVQRKAAANKANLAAITRAERTGAAQGRQYERALKRGMTLERAQNFLQTGKLPGRDNSIAAQRITKQARDRLAAKNATRAATRTTKPAARRPDQAEVNIKGRFTGQAGKRLDASIDRAVKQVKASEQARLMKPKAQVKAERAARAEANRQAAAAKPKRTRTAESQRISRAKQVEKRRSITTNPAGERASAAAKMAANAARTQQRATAFLKATAKPAAAPKAAKPAPKVDTSMKGVAARRARALAPRTSTYLSQKLNTQSSITRSAANAIYNKQRSVGKQLGLDKAVIRNPIGIMSKTSGSTRSRAEQLREAARKRVVGGRRR